MLEAILDLQRLKNFFSANNCQHVFCMNNFAVYLFSTTHIELLVNSFFFHLWFRMLTSWEHEAHCRTVDVGKLLGECHAVNSLATATRRRMTGNSENSSHFSRFNEEWFWVLGYGTVTVLIIVINTLALCSIVKNAFLHTNTHR